MAVEVKTKKWGNSVGVVIPVDTAKSLDIKPDEEVIIEIRKKNNVLKDLFGAIKFKKQARELVKEARRELEGKWLK